MIVVSISYSPFTVWHRCFNKTEAATATLDSKPQSLFLLLEDTALATNV